MLNPTLGDPSADELAIQRRRFAGLRDWSIDFPATLWLLTGGLLLPNALAVVGGLWIGVPTRTTAIAAYAAVALLCTLLPRILVVPLFVAALLIDCFGLVAHIFYLDLSLITQNIPAFTHVKITASPFYIEAALASALFIVAKPPS